MNKQNRTIQKYRFRIYHFYNEDNLFLAYVYLALGMMRQDRDDLRTQQNLLFVQLKRRFGTWDKEEIQSYYLDILKGYPDVEMKTLFDWLNKKSNNREKIHILDILADLAYHNHLLTPAEFKYLYYVAENLKLSQTTVRSIISIRQSRMDERNQQTKQNAFVNKESLIKRKLHVLGLNHAKSQEEIKQAYRKLAKLHHPDLFAKKSKSEQDMANERFIEIKNAYDYLMGHFK